MNYRTLSIFGPIGIVFGIAGIGFSIYQTTKMKETSDKIDMTIDELKNDSAIDIKQAVVDKAIERAVEREVRLAVSDTARRVRDDIREEIRTKVKHEVEEQYNKIADETAEKISNQVAQIDEYALKERVTKKAEDKVMRKLDGCLDGALGMFNNKLGSVSKIYENIEGILSSRATRDGRGINLRLD